MYAVAVFLYTVWECGGVFYFRPRFLCLKQPSKNSNSKIVTAPEPFGSRVKAPPAKRSEKGYGDENAWFAFCFVSSSLSCVVVAFAQTSQMALD